jgi:hypothetical protein
VCTQLFWFFRCRVIQDHHYLLADMRVKCWEGEWAQVEGYAWLGVIVFMFGIPLAQLSYMWYYRKHLQGGDGADSRNKALHYKVQKRMGSLYEQYAPAFWWINIVEKLYVLAISGGVVILGDDSVARCLMAVLLSAMWILFITYYQPYRAHWDNFLAALLAVELILTLVVGMASSMDQSLAAAATAVGAAGAAGSAAGSAPGGAAASVNGTTALLPGGADAGDLFERDAKDFWIEATNVFVIGIAAMIVAGSTPCVKTSMTKWLVRCWPRCVKRVARRCEGCCRLFAAKARDEGRGAGVKGEQQQQKKKDKGNTTKEDELDEEEGRRSQSPSNAPRDREEDGELQRIFLGILESLNPEQRERVQGAEMREMRERLEADHAAALAEKDAALAEHATALAEKDSALAEHATALAEHATALAEKDSALAEHATALAKEKLRCHALAEEQKHALAELAAARKHSHASTTFHENRTLDVTKVAEKNIEGGSILQSKSFKQRQLLIEQPSMRDSIKERILLARYTEDAARLGAAAAGGGERKDNFVPAPPPGPPPISPPDIA